MLLTKITHTQRGSLAALADGWLASGAATFDIRTNDRSLLSWSRNGASHDDVITAPIRVDGSLLGELRVSGLSSPADRARLRAEAELVAQLVRLERDLRLMTSDLVQTQDQLLSLYKLTRTTRHHLGIQDILNQLSSETIRLLPVEGVFTLVTADDGPLLVEHYPNQLLPTSRLRSYLAELERSGQEEMVWQEKDDPDGLRNLFVVHKQIHGAVTVAMGLINKDDNEFSAPDTKLAHTVVENGAAQIENMLLYEETLQQTRLQAEMDLAQSVQLNLLPSQAPQVEGLDLWADSRPASRVGGDFYDFLVRQHRPFTFVIGDISGKGMSSAMLMAMTRAVIRAKVKSRLTPRAILRRANTSLYDDFTRVSMFATVFVGQYEPQAQELLYANAGHSPVIYCPAGENARLLEADGTAMGILASSLSQDHRLKLQPGDLLVVATDGFSEAWNLNEEMYGYERLLRKVESLAHQPARDIARELYNSVNSFSVGRKQEDDQTVLVLKAVDKET